MDTVDIASIEANMPNLQSLSFGRNVYEIIRGELNRHFIALKDLKKVEFSNDVERIKEHSFANCVGITDVKFGENIKEIGANCFSGCGLETVTLPNQLSKIGAFVFSDCPELKSVNLPENISQIENCAFRGCKNLESINLPDKLSEIGDFVFDGCLKLGNINLPENLSKIGKAAFYSLRNNINSVLHIPQNIIDLNESIQAFDSGIYLEANGNIFETKQKNFKEVFLKPLKKEEKLQNHAMNYRNKRETRENRGNIESRID